MRGEIDGEEENIEREEQPCLFENGIMRSYQLDGFSWLLVSEFVRLPLMRDYVRVCTVGIWTLHCVLLSF